MTDSAHTIIAPAVDPAEVAIPLDEIDFPLWSHIGDGYTPPSNKEWLNEIIIVRLAFQVLTRDKHQLAQVFRDDCDIALDLIDDISRVRRNLSKTLAVLSTAEARLLAVGGAVVEIEQAEAGK